jgi:ribosomal protein L29
MAKNCKKKSTTMSTIERKLARVKTLRNKETKLIRQLKNNPADLSAQNALAQVRHDLVKGV